LLKEAVRKRLGALDESAGPSDVGSDSGDA